MALKIIWSKRAEKGFSEIVTYLEKEFTDKEVKRFINESNQFFELLIKNPKILQKTKSHSNLYRGPINRLTIVTYQYKPRLNEILLVNIRSTRQKPLS